MSRLHRVPSVLIVLALAGSAWAQVGPTQQGNLLDSNFQVGSGGYNRVTGGLGGVNSQLYVTGQVTGLGAFRGPVGYAPEDQLRLALPSADLSAFRRQSVGLQDALRGESYVASPYYERTETIVGYPGIARGENIPGSNAPAVLRPLEPLEPLDTRKYQFFEPALPPASPALGAGGTLTGLALPGGTVWIAPPAAARPAEGADPFASLGDNQRLDLARELLELRRRQQEQEDQRVPVPQQVRTLIDTRVVPQVGEAMPAQAQPRTQSPAPAGLADEDQQQRVLQGAQQAQQQPGQVPPNQDVFYDMLMQLRQQELRRQAQPPGQLQPPPGRQEGLQEQTTPGRLQPSPARQGLQEMPVPDKLQPPSQDEDNVPPRRTPRDGRMPGAYPLQGTAPQARDLADRPPRREDGLVTPELPGRTQLEQMWRPSEQPRAAQIDEAAEPGVRNGQPTEDALGTEDKLGTEGALGAEPSQLVESLPGQGLVLHELAGKSQDVVNHHMKVGQDYLRNGRFYEAANEFELAAAVDPRNPLPQMGAGLSLFAAGEALSAGLRIRKSMELFEPLIQSRIDVTRVIGDLHLIQDRLVILQDRLERADEEIKPLLLFVATFMYHNLGQTRPAEHFARQLLTMTGHPVYPRYAAAVLAAPGGQAPPAQAPATQGAP